MTRENEIGEKIAELNTMFLTLNDRGQDNALNILRALKFAQSVMAESDDKHKKKDGCLYNQ